MSTSIWTALPKIDPKGVIWRGAVFRCKAKWPYEGIVDFMLVHTHDAESEFAMLVATGMKSGIVFQILPPECRADGNRIAVAAGWLQENWTTWIYPDCPPEDVLFTEHYPTPGGMP